MPDILPTIAQKLDASPRIINNWRQWPKMLGTQIAALGAVFNLILAGATAAIPAAGLIVIWPMRIVLVVGAILFVMAAVAKLFTQKNVTPVP
jgi:hypothetical protein